MKYLKLFNTEAEYTAFKASSAFCTPNVSYIKETNGVSYISERTFYSEKYLTFVAKEQGTFTLTIGSAVTTSILQSIMYSVDDGETWTTTNNVNDQTVTITTPSVLKNDKVLWKGIGIGVSTTINNSNRPSTSSIFSSTGTFDVEGNIMSLIYGDDFIGKDYVANGSSYNFALMFYSYPSHVTEVAKVVSAKNMCMPIKNIPAYCYFRMFQSCPSLTIAPSVINAESVGENACKSMFYGCSVLATASELPATILGVGCYSYMFQHCSSLITLPKSLPATALTDNCYEAMFGYCTALVSVPLDFLPATTLTYMCYTGMFQFCSSLTIAPNLPATTLATDCYWSLFEGCTSLTTAPALPAMVLANRCYKNMFDDCTSLVTVPSVLPATTLVDGVYESMFQGCTSLTTAPNLSAKTLTSRCYYDMFNGCTRLSSVTCYATDISATDCTKRWLNNVAASGDIFIDGSMQSVWPTGVDGIPAGWTAWGD